MKVTALDAPVKLGRLGFLEGQIEAPENNELLFSAASIWEVTRRV